MSTNEEQRYSDDEDFDFVDIEKIKNEALNNDSDEQYNFVEMNNPEVRDKSNLNNTIKHEVNNDKFENNLTFIESKEALPTTPDKTIRNQTKKVLENSLTTIELKNTRRERRLFPQDEFLSCDQCDLRTPYLSNLKKHKLSVHEKLRSLCDICNREFACVKSHKDVVHAKVKGFKCDMCDYSCVKPIRLKYHKDLVHFKQHLKKACPQCFVVCSDLDSHIQRIHEKPLQSPSDEPIFSCEECEFTAKSMFSIRSHIRTTHRKIMINCSVCSKSVNKWTISVHMRKHTENKYKCNPCEKTYREKRDLAKHILYAHKNFRHQCKFCHKEVPNILSHIKFMHKNKANEIIDKDEEHELFKEIKMKLGVNPVYNAEF